MTLKIRLDQLDFLRGIAAVYVLINHARGAFFIGGEKLLAVDPSPLNYLAVALLQLTSLGAEMVILFFVLSGFAMAHSVRRSPVGMFYAKRVLRIWPPYLAACALAFVVGHVVGVDLPASVLVYVNASTDLTPQFWSLPYEVVFYALCPLLLASRQSVHWFSGIAVLGTIATVGFRGVMLNPWDNFAANFLGNEMLFFACGAMAYHHFDRIPQISAKLLAAVVGGAFLAAVILKVWLGGTTLPANLIIIAATALSIRNMPLNIPSWANAGSFSYSIYIYHYAIIVLLAFGLAQSGVDPRSITSPLLWVWTVLPILGTCYLLYLVTERPANKAVAWLRDRNPPQAMLIKPSA